MASCKGVLLDPMATLAAMQSQGEQPGVLLDPTVSGGGSGHLPTDLPMEDIDPSMSEVYFLVMHFLAGSPCTRAFFQLWNELLEHKLLPRRFHAWYSRGGTRSGDENDDGVSFPLSYSDIVARHPNIEQGHLVKLLKQLLVYNRNSVAQEPGNSRIPTGADVPTLLGTGAFSLLESERSKAPKEVLRWTRQLRWPHWQADQVHGLMLRELGGGFARHNRAPTIRTASYVVTKPAVLVDRIQIIKKLRGHRNAVYCAIFDNTGHHVITGSDDRLVKIWCAETGLCLRSCRGHEGDITDMAVSSGNSLVASASNDHSIRVWGLPNGVPVSVLRGHTAAVTAIAFSPRQGCEHLLLSTSDDGTCRIWDAKDSTLNSRVYMPNPRDIPTALRGTGLPTPPAAPAASNQVLCCAFNADGSIFVTGSSDKMARVWDACKWNDDVTGRPNYELDTLRGHEHDVNYVQFSGCAAPARPSTTDAGKEDCPPQFKNSWFAHDSIVTCSRDGSAIIWTPRPRKHHGKVGRWQKAYHLRVPPPPMPPQPPRGNGPRQRLLPTPRGVNMIVWSLDNRFVLAAIMDHRICVWNAVDGSLVHSLTGHDKQTYVLDVHPFNPRIAMSAGYDGRVIIWDIWEGHPIKVYETGEYNLVDGNFSPDGASLVVSDEVGQIYIFGTGPEMSSKDVKYDQFFLGDFRPLIRDTFGNVLDMETQLTPHRRNVQDLLCDANLIPYPEPYQSIYQQRRLGALGIEWNPPSVYLAIGMSDDAVFTAPPPDQVAPVLPVMAPSSPERRDRRGLVTGSGGTRWVEQPSEADEAMEWEQEGAGLGEDTGSDYSASEESQSEAERDPSGESLNEDGLASDEDEGEEDGRHLRRSQRNKRKKEEYIHTASGRRVRRRTFNDDGGAERRPCHRQSRLLRPGPSNARVTHSPVPARPQRHAARNALNLSASSNPSQEDAATQHTGITAPQEPPHVPPKTGATLDAEETPSGSVTVQSVVTQAPIAATHLSEAAREVAEPVPDAVDEVATIVPEAPDSIVECRRPRSQRRLIVKLRTDSGGPSGGAAQAPGVENNQDRNGNGTVRPTEPAPSAGASVDTEQLLEVVAVLQWEGVPSQQTVRIKPPAGPPADTGLEAAGASQSESGGGGDGDRPVAGNGKALVPAPDSDEDLSHDAKRKWEWKKVKAAKRARGSNSPDLGTSNIHGGCTQNGGGSVQSDAQDAHNSAAALPQESMARVLASETHEPRESDAVVSRDEDTRQGWPALKMCASNGALVTKRLGGAPLDRDLPEDNEPPQVESVKVTCVENKGASMDYMDLPKWRQVRKSGPCMRPRIHISDVDDADDDKSPAATSSPKEEYREKVTRPRPDEQEPEEDDDNEDVEMDGINNEDEEVEYDVTGPVSVEDSEPELGDDASAKVESSVANCSEDEEECGNSPLLLKCERPSLGDCVDEDEGTVGSQQETSDTDEPPPLVRAPWWHGAKSAQLQDESVEEEEEEEEEEDNDDNDDDKEEEEGPDSEREEEEGHSHSDLYEDTQASTHEWSDSGKESDDESVDAGRSTARPKRALGDISEHSRHAPAGDRPADLSTGVRRIRNMQSVLYESGRATRTRSSKQRPSKATVAPPPNRHGNRAAASNRGGQQRRSRPQRNYTNNGFANERSLRASTRARGAPNEEMKESTEDDDEWDRHLDYESREETPPLQLAAASRGKLRSDRKGKGKVGENGATGSSGHHGQQGGRRKCKPGPRSLDVVAWLLMEDVEPGTRFIPQFGDEVVYLRQGHQDFLEESHIDEKGPWKTFKLPVRAVEHCRITGLDYTMDADSGKKSCKLTLEFIDSTSRLHGKSFKLTLPELTNYPDYFVERSRFDAALRKAWSPRDHCQVWWASAEEKGGSWWDGRIKQIKAKSKEFPDSPWEMYHVTYKSGSTEVTSHSPWELFDKDYKIDGWELPSIPEATKDALLTAISNVERACFKKDPYGVEQHREDVKDADFLSRVPLPLSFDTIWVRVERNYYHSTEALEHDVRLLVANAALFHGQDSEEAAKMQRLADFLIEAL